MRAALLEYEWPAKTRGAMTAAITEASLKNAFNAASAHFLGRGSFGETWCVEGIPGKPQTCAIKILHAGTFNLRRLERETTSLRRFDSAGIVKLHAVETITVDDETLTVLVCEHIDGGDAKQKLSGGSLPKYSTVRHFAIGLLDAVRELHAADTWHRDIKPANILLRDGQWRTPVLIDFGLARAATDLTMTAYPQQVGTLLYMAPEALRGEPARKLADLWSCGVVLYELLTGRHPFINDLAGLLPDDVVDLVVGEPFALPDDVPDDVRDVVLRFLSHSPHSRGTAIRALNDLLKGRG